MPHNALQKIPLCLNRTELTRVIQIGNYLNAPNDEVLAYAIYFTAEIVRATRMGCKIFIEEERPEHAFMSVENRDGSQMKRVPFCSHIDQHNDSCQELGARKERSTKNLLQLLRRENYLVMSLKGDNAERFRELQTVMTDAHANSTRPGRAEIVEHATLLLWRVIDGLLGEQRVEIGPTPEGMVTLWYVDQDGDPEIADRLYWVG